MSEDISDHYGRGKILEMNRLICSYRGGSNANYDSIIADCVTDISQK